MKPSSCFQNIYKLLIQLNTLFHKIRYSSSICKCFVLFTSYLKHLTYLQQEITPVIKLLLGRLPPSLYAYYKYVSHKTYRLIQFIQYKSELDTVSFFQSLQSEKTESMVQR